MRWIALIGFLISFSVHAHEPRCEDQLLTVSSVYAHLIDLGIERGWITPERLARAVDRDARVLKKQNADSESLPLVRALNEQVSRMSAEDLKQAFQILRERHAEISRHAISNQLAQEKTATIIAPKEIKRVPIKVPFSFNEHTKTILVPRRGALPLVVFSSDRHTLVIDPAKNLRDPDEIPEFRSDFSISNTILTTDGRVLFTYSNPRGGNGLWVKDLLDPSFDRFVREGYPQDHQWVKSKDGRTFLIEWSDLAGRPLIIYEYTGGTLKPIFSRKMKFVDFISNEKGEVRIIGKLGTTVYVYDPASQTLKAEWDLGKNYHDLEAFLSREGVTYLKIFADWRIKYTDGYKRSLYHYIFYKEGEAEAVTVRRGDSQRSQWHQLKDGRVVYPLSAFADYEGREMTTFGLIEPFPEQPPTSFWRKLFKKRRTAKIWNSFLDTTVPTQYAQWSSDDEYIFEKDGILFNYRWENDRMVLSSKISLSFSPQQVHRFPDLLIPESKVVLALDHDNAAIALPSLGTLFTPAVRPGILSDLYVDREQEQTYFVTAEHPTEDTFILHLYELYQKPSGDK